MRNRKENMLKSNTITTTLNNFNNSKNTTREEENLQFNFPTFPKGFDESQLSLYHSLLLKQCTKCDHRNEHANNTTSKPEIPTRSTIQNDCIKTIPRVNPLSSGVSFRSLPKATCDDIIKVCNFYVEKCEGKYSEKTRAYRMMVEMANEIIKLTNIIQRDFEVEYSKQREQNVHLNKVCEEWNNYFGKTVDDKYSKLSPRDIRLIIDKLEMDVKKYEDTLNEERLRHYEQERKLHLMINEHHEASRKSIRNMMKQTSAPTFQKSPTPLYQPNFEQTSLVETLLEENRQLKKQVQELTGSTSKYRTSHHNMTSSSTLQDSISSNSSSSQSTSSIKYNTLFQ
ncbi:predicted protein [Naegleria gruberi]|uniref:Predicted protein n=1 Tax=Naegleria gruberi TaxID=5762 RepID=D2W2G1_NAEGR|nr:uncharacterized protein NAEGRDRAFT_54178 [Naegleria gruberi]EFC36704.1 predicted protein [Naegleria gruberi]|eukprot:XP_002669448.1 predicted protein [Naegleria gruberi strain NEG-M]